MYLEQIFLVENFHLPEGLSKLFRLVLSLSTKVKHDKNSNLLSWSYHPTISMVKQVGWWLKSWICRSPKRKFAKKKKQTPEVGYSSLSNTTYLVLDRKPWGSSYNLIYPWMTGLIVLSTKNHLLLLLLLLFILDFGTSMLTNTHTRKFEWFSSQSHQILWTVLWRHLKPLLSSSPSPLLITAKVMLLLKKNKSESVAAQLKIK